MTPGSAVRTALQPLLLASAALEFLTPVRLRGGGRLDDTIVGRSSSLFPLVGLLLGLALLGFERVAGGLFPPLLVNALLVTLYVTATGAIHLDGLADTVDGLFGGHTPARRLEIMRDSRIGTFGALALLLVLLLQLSALSALDSPWRRPGLLLYPVLGRSAMVVALAAFPYARPEGLGVLFRSHVLPWPLAFAQLSALTCAIICFGGSGTVLWAASVLVALGLGALAIGLLGGLTGDTYGAIGEIVQIVILLLIVSAHRLGWLLPWLIRG